jgi:hypothetical protein
VSSKPHVRCSGNASLSCAFEIELEGGQQLKVRPSLTSSLTPSSVHRIVCGTTSRWCAFTRR